MFEFRLPDIGEGVVDGEVVRWLVKVGESVREDQPMVEVMTDKATVEIPSPKAGRIASIHAPEGQICKVGQVMVRIEVAGSAATASPAAPTHVAPVATAPAHLGAAAAAGPASTAPVAVAVPVAAVVAAIAVPAASARTGKAMATPATRKIARDAGVDINLVPGSGDKGRVTSDDVRAFAEHAATNGNAGHAAVAVPAADAHAALRSPTSSQNPVIGFPPHAAPAQLGDERVPFRGVRKKIAENMSRSKHAAAHFTYVDEADLTDLVALRARAKKRAEERGIKLSFLPFIIKAVVAGLKKFPIVNATLDEDKQEIVLRRQYHIGVAAASQQGLVVPVLRDADKKSLFEIARELDELTEKAKTGKASREELTGSTFTISSLGAIGGLLATPIINFPEVAILGVHKIKRMPVVRPESGDQIVIRDVGNFSVSLDHRVVDGYEGALFLQHVIELLSDPTLMFMELV